MHKAKQDTCSKRNLTDVQGCSAAPYHKEDEHSALAWNNMTAMMSGCEVNPKDRKTSGRE